MDNNNTPPADQCSHDAWEVVGLRSRVCADCRVMLPSEIRPVASSPPADDVREAIYEIIRFGDDRDEMDTVDRILARFEVRSRGTVTTTSGDLREAMAHVLAEHYYVERWSGGEASCTCRQWVESVQRKPYTTWAQHVADALIAAEVRPYGTVTEPSDAEVLAALNATVKAESVAPDLSFWGGETVARMRASLNAAAEVRERAEA